MFGSEDAIHSAESGRSYVLVKALGHGAFGEVLLAQDAANPSLQYAIKQLYLRDQQEQGLPLPVQRELAALRQLQHRHVVALVDVARAGPCLYLVQELCATDLAAVLQAASRLIPLGVVRAVMQQLLAALAACHGAGLMHRDVKPSNVLITAGGDVKLADFGLARAFGSTAGSQQQQQQQHDTSPGQQQQPMQQQQLLHDPELPADIQSSLCHQQQQPSPCGQQRRQPSPRSPAGCCACLTSCAGTRWYRAPELLYASTSYGPAVDVWAAGLLLAELLGLAPLLPGQSDIDQLARMNQTLGSISLTDWPEAAQLPDWHKISFGHSPGQPLEHLLPDAPGPALELLRAMLAYPPATRLTAAEALQHAWLAGGPAPAAPAEVAAYVSGVLQQPRPSLQLAAAGPGSDGGSRPAAAAGWQGWTSSDEDW